MDALTAKLGRMSKPQIILTAAGAGIAMAIAYRLADRTLDSIIPKKKVDEEIVEEGARLGCIGIPSGDVDIDILPPI